MSQYSGNVATGVLSMGEPVTLVQEAVGVFDTATQTHHSGVLTTTETFGVTRMMVAGVDGVDVRSGDLEVWFSSDLLASVVPKINDQLVLGTSRLQILQVGTNTIMGYYRVTARGVE